MLDMSVEYTDAPTIRPEPSAADKMPCPYCGHLLPKDTESCDRCDWTRPATETAEGKASDAVAGIIRVVFRFGDNFKGEIFSGVFFIGGAVPVGGFLFLFPTASPRGGVGLFFFFLCAPILFSY